MQPGAPQIEVLPDAAAVVAAADRRFRALASRAIAERGRFAVALSGGRTPNDLYRSLARAAAGSIDWQRVHLFWGDERAVEPNDPQSNYGNAMTALAGAPIPPANVHRMRAESTPPELGAAEYDALLRSFYALGDDEWPVFDLVLLGLGPDGHTASLFPGSAGLAERRRIAIAHWVPAQSSYRLTLTYPVLNAAREVVFLATGAEKAEILTRLLVDHDDSLPASGVRPTAGELRFLLDAPAAAGLGR